MSVLSSPRELRAVIFDMDGVLCDSEPFLYEAARAMFTEKYGVEVKQGLVDYLFTHTDCAAVQGTPNVANVASIKMQEAVGAVRVDERVYEFPEGEREDRCSVHHYVYRVFRPVWEQRTF